jgi:DNA polymerase-3 subunit alpha
MSEVCNSKNCNCGKQHIYKDDLTEVAKGNLHKAMDTFEERKYELGNVIKEEDRRKRPMVHLHLHTFHSILDGCGSIDNYVKLAKEYNHPAIAVTDHGTLSGTYELFKKCKAGGVKSIMGMEAYVNDKQGEFEEKKYEGGNSHQSIFVMNQEGFVNINRLAYRSYDEGFYKRGRIKTDWLFEHKQGLFLTTSCAVSHMSKLVLEGRETEAEEYLKGLMREFGDNLVAELQFNEYDGQKIYNRWLLRMIKKYSLMPILTNDVHYAFKEDAELQDTLIAINQKSKLGNSFKLNTRNLYYANVDDFHIFNKKFGFNYPDSFVDLCLNNTLKVAEKLNYEFDTKTEKFPRYEVTTDVLDYFKTDSTEEIITRLAFGKLKQKLIKYKENNIVEITPEKEKEYHDRLTYELEVIREKNTLDYFMVYWELIRDYRKKGYNIGPSRGSAGGCLLSWCLEITDIDPIRFDLYFERFLNPTRKGLPDIDVDFMKGTDDVTNNFLYEKYGKNRVLSVSTFSTFNEKGCLKDVVRAHFGDEETGFESDVHAVTKEMPNFDRVEYSLGDWFEKWPNDPACSDRVRRWLTDKDNRKILDQTLMLQGQIRGIGQHAAGIVITPGPCWEYLPTNIIASNKSIVTAFQEADKSGKDLSELNILKLDRLKLETLNVIEDTIKIVKDKYGHDITDKVRNVNLNDENLFIELRLGLNHGIFQFESPGMNALIRGMATESFSELTAANALYRPGPMGIGAHEEFIKNKFNPENIKYVHPALETILRETNGVLIYQEQLMFLANKVGGMSLGEGDMLRRYMDKASSAIMKKSSGETLNKKEQDNYIEFEKYWNKFIDGAVKNGYKADEVDVIKDWVIKYLGYSFNKSHSTAYAYLAMQTLYLKHYHPTEFYTALLNHPKTSGGKEKEQSWLASAIASAMSKGIVISPPSRKSGWTWTVTGEKEISMGFSGINGLGDIAYQELVELMAKKNKNLQNISVSEFYDLPFSKFNKKAFESCIKAGVFDEWSESREYLIALREKKKKKVVVANQMSLFDMSSKEFDIKTDDIGHHLKTTESQKRDEFIEVCNFDLEKIKFMLKIKTTINLKAKKPLDNIINFEDEGWYFFVLEEFTTMISKTGKEYLTLRVGDGVNSTTLRVFDPLAKKIKPEMIANGVYVAKFEKNDGGFINFARNTQFKRVEI